MPSVEHFRFLNNLNRAFTEVSGLIAFWWLNNVVVFKYLRDDQYGWRPLVLLRVENGAAFCDVLVFINIYFPSRGRYKSTFQGWITHSFITKHCVVRKELLVYELNNNFPERTKALHFLNELTLSVLNRVCPYNGEGNKVNQLRKREANVFYFSSRFVWLV